MDECLTWATECEFMLNDSALNIVDYRLLPFQAGVKMKELAQMAGEPIQKGRKRKL